MRDDSEQQKSDQFEQLVRRALATPPISNEEIERRSKEIKGKRA